MKFLNNNTTKNIYFESRNSDLEIFYNNIYDYSYVKTLPRSRKVLNNIKVGITKNVKKNSIKRDKNNTLIQQYVNLTQKNGNKFNICKNINVMLENFYFFLSNDFEHFNSYYKYKQYVYLHNTYSNYSNINYILGDPAESLESLFEIKTKKNNKKLKLPNKYSYEIVYIHKKKRKKYFIRALSIFKNNFKNYKIWERFLWSFFLTILNTKNSFVSKRKNYIYSKSIKFFKKPQK